jgi:hypothetical protein
MITNHRLVFEALSRAEAGRADAPDEVSLVSAFREGPWFMTCLRGTGASCYDEEERYQEIDPATLGRGDGSIAKPVRSPAPAAAGERRRSASPRPKPLDIQWLLNAGQCKFSMAAAISLLSHIAVNDPSVQFPPSHTGLSWPAALVNLIEFLPIQPLH